MEFIKGALIFVLVLAALVLLPWVFMGNDYFLYKAFAPKMEAARRETFEQSKAYNQGMTQELESMMIQYQSAKPEGKDAICSVVRHRVADYPTSGVPSHLLGFVNTCRGVEH
jgi:hypothetical protein